MFGPEHCIYAHSIQDIQETDVSQRSSMLSASQYLELDSLDCAMS